MADVLPALLKRLRLDRALAAHDPVLIGARPLRLRESGAVVILCRSGRGFSDRLAAVYGEHAGFTLLAGEGIEGCTFTLMDTPVQIVGRPKPVRQQRDWRAFQTMIHLLRILGEPLKEAVVAALTRGVPLERAFCSAMGADDLLPLSRATPVAIRARWQEARRPKPAVVAPVVLPEPTVSEAAGEDAEELLRRPDALLKDRRVVWLDGTRLLPVSRHELPPPRRRDPDNPPRRLAKAPKKR